MWQALARYIIALLLSISLDLPFIEALPERSSALQRRGALSGATLWFNDPGAWDIEQDNRGDCWLMGVLSSIAYVDPHKIKSIIKGDGNTGDVSVTLMKKSGPKTFVVSEALMQKHWKLDSDSHKGNKYEWPSAMEEAFAMVQKEDPDLGTPHNLDGADPLHAYQAIYGFDSKAQEQALQDMKDPDIWAVITRATEIPVSASSNPKIKGFHHIMPDHEYAIKSADSKAGKMVMRNPWSMVTDADWLMDLDAKHVKDLGHGEFECDFDYFKGKFSWIIFVDIAPIVTPSKLPGT